MSELETAEFDSDDISDDAELLATLVPKDSKMQQKLEARRRIDELMEQKRLRSLLDDWDLDDDE
ncbi:PA3496 family putative envelope integrity protein [Rheinheimera sp. MMS21-TC3]|uniref:PA3496 family putative envelope integrity protein n=1 Tax=Rheinheimera sp. MMS21-TC3 TaxID=3072790 RepID=UPI0028C4DA42|nr:hypothetical protein [Rheinheimera sp. MMS21-TC3]WNO60028.1 hypothetical protein RDV63_03465 [Rheinheimera sp. MMS21-TC3]